MIDGFDKTPLNTFAKIWDIAWGISGTGDGLTTEMAKRCCYARLWYSAPKLSESPITFRA
jgi:hypothetical protein